MARIYLSYAYQDKALASEISGYLQQYGHQLAQEKNEILPGTFWNELIADTFLSADGIVFLITPGSVISSNLLFEIGAAKAYLDKDSSKFFIPVVTGRTIIPETLKEINCLIGDETSAHETASRINQAIRLFYAARKLTEEKQARRIENIEKNASQYVGETLDILQRREARNKATGNFWYVLGFLCLAGGVVFGISGVKDFLSAEKIAASAPMTLVIALSIKTAVIIGLLIACSKYSFTLGKSFINESLKNADRAHAISFGKFYLDAYGSTAKWEELKEAFQYWNISNDSVFSRQDTKEFDPGFVELVTGLSKVVASRAGKK